MSIKGIAYFVLLILTIISLTSQNGLVFGGGVVLFLITVIILPSNGILGSGKIGQKEGNKEE